MKKGVYLDPNCPFCNMCVENSAHLFMHCEIAKLIWFSSPLGVHIPPQVDLNDWILSWLTCKDSFAIQIFCTTLWKIWTARNHCLFQKTAVIPHVIAADALDFVLEFNKANPSKKLQRQLQQSDVREPIYKGFNLLQTDAGCYVNGSVAMDCVIKNQSDDIILSASHRESFGTDPATAEALAIRWCLQIAAELKLDKILVQSDALNVVDCLNGVISSAILDPLILDCKHILSSFKQFAVMFISRNLNVDVHYMVGVGNVVGSNKWMGIIPKHGVDILCNSSFDFV